MAEKFYSIVTKTGQAKMANAVALGQKINFLKMKIGDSNGSYYEPTETQTDLVNIVYETNITNVYVDSINPNYFHIEGMIPSTDGGFTIREYGIYDTDDDLIAVCKCAETYKPIISDGSTKELLLDMVICVLNADAIELKIDSTVIFAKKSDIIELRTYVNEQVQQFSKNGFPLVIASGTNTYVGTNNDVGKLVLGTKILLVIQNTSNSICSLNLNSSGFKEIKDEFGKNVTRMNTSVPYLLIYNGNEWITTYSSYNVQNIYNKVDTNDSRISELNSRVVNMAKIYSGSSEPSSSLGNNGDIYIKY